VQGCLTGANRSCYARRSDEKYLNRHHLLPTPIRIARIEVYNVFTIIVSCPIKFIKKMDLVHTKEITQTETCPHSPSLEEPLRVYPSDHKYSFLIFLVFLITSIVPKLNPIFRTNIPSITLCTFTYIFRKSQNTLVS
jgi:hypothetical protein